MRKEEANKLYKEAYAEALADPKAVRIANYVEDCQRVDAAVLAERERCAGIVEVESAKRNSHAGVLHEAWSIEIAARIRSDA